MLSEGDLRVRNTVGEPVGEHPVGAVPGLFGGLGQSHQRAPPCPLGSRHQTGRPQQTGDVQVVTARVRHWHPPAGGVLGAGRAGVRQAGLLADRQGIHVGAQQNGRTVAVGQQADHTGAADPVVHLVAAAPQAFRHTNRGPVLLVAQLGVGMQVLVEVFQLGPHVTEPCNDRVHGTLEGHDE